MAKKTETIECKFPADIVARLEAVAKLAGMPVESVIKVVIATEVHRWKVRQSSPNP